MDFIYMPLGPMDHCPPPTPQPSVIYFGIKPGVTYAQVFSLLQQGLHQVFLRAPWLNGKVHAQAPATPGWRPGQLEVRYSADVSDAPKCPQLRYNELDGRVSFEEIKLRGFPIDIFTDEELTWAAYNPKGADFDAGVDVVAAQANFLPGACLLCPSVHHATCDAIGMGVFMKLWADECRALSLDMQGRNDKVARLPATIWDRTLPERLWQQEAPADKPLADIDPAAWRMLGMDPPRPDVSLEQALAPPVRTRLVREPQDMTSCIFYMSGTAFKALRAVCQQSAAAPADISGNDAILALMWRTLMRARVARKREQEEGEAVADLDKAVELQIVNDARAAFSDALPPVYLGNCIFHHRPTATLGQLLDNAGLPAVAAAIRASTRDFRHDTVQDAYRLMRSLPDWTRLHPLRHMSVADTWMLSSMIAVDDRSASFGDALLNHGGRPHGFRMLMSNRNRSQVHACYVMPQQAHGGVEVVLSALADEWPHVLADKEFGLYTEVMA